MDNYLIEINDRMYIKVRFLVLLTFLALMFGITIGVAVAADCVMVVRQDPRTGKTVHCTVCKVDGNDPYSTPVYVETCH